MRFETVRVIEIIVSGLNFGYRVILNVDIFTESKT